MRAEVMERIEENNAEDIMTEDDYNNLVRISMDKVKSIIKPLIDIEIHNII